MTKLVMALGGAGLAALATVLAVALGGTGGSPTPVGSTATAERTTTTVDDISGPCDEAEHRNDPRCTSVPAPAQTVETGDRREPGEDVRGPCDEAEHRNDPRCTGAAGMQEDRSGPGSGDDHDHSGPGRGSDDDENRSGSNSGRG
jgi:hypothetical protein